MRRLLTAAAALLVATCALAYRAGDTVLFTFEPRDAAGLATVPTEMTAIIYKGLVPIDSTKTLLSGISALPVAGGHSARSYAWTWTVPSSGASSLASYSGVLHALVCYSASGITRDWGQPSPALVPINHSIVDTLIASTVMDFWAGYTDSTVAIVEPGSWGATTVTYQGSPVTGAQVFVSTLSGGGGRVGYAVSSAGQYAIPVTAALGASNTYYVWAIYAGRWVKQAEEVTIP